MILQYLISALFVCSAVFALAVLIPSTIDGIRKYRRIRRQLRELGAEVKTKSQR